MRIGRIGLSFHAVTAAVTEAVLVRLGHSVTRRTGGHPEIFPLLGAGEVDLLVAAWLPHAHGRLFAPVAPAVVEAATLYEGARLFLAVPGSTDPTIRSVADLSRPEVAAAAERRIVGVAPGSGSALGAEAMLDAYGLRAAGWSLTVGNAGAWVAAMESGLASGRLFAAPLWTPLWTDRAFGMRPLEDPLGVYGGADRAVVLVRREAWESWPARTRAVVGRIALGIEAVAAMDEATARGGLTPEDAARRWMDASAPVVERWFAGA
ncbi:glycine betaine ABC transporter substrate-binding protein [Falsiroseomonas sp. E2-1-a20]|uniref:glycine betaine ABC transporter substrate-binding protein n=1 Tax=Falsiroseomonas sp. E2-1-a20 TaxID=3239300 RepID=UPI003F5A460B